ncbi:MAG: methylenetetrahydrofolate reductase C-terminal domain-containing protein [Pseudomonadota bacterium]
MYAVRRFAVRQSRFFQRFYDAFEQVIVTLDPLFTRIGYAKLEAPAAAVERTIKSVLFDCQMCGQCALSSTGMSCPMNCPKQLRNGPCGGVRAGGMCEVEPQMRCVWVEAWDGAGRMHGGLEKIGEQLPPVDRSLKGTSSWLRVARDKAQEQREARAAGSLALAGSLGTVSGPGLGETTATGSQHVENPGPGS